MLKFRFFENFLFFQSFEIVEYPIWKFFKPRNLEYLFEKFLNFQILELCRILRFQIFWKSIKFRICAIFKNYRFSKF